MTFHRLTAVVAAFLFAASAPGGVEAFRRLRIVSPLQTLTIWDPEARGKDDAGSNENNNDDDTKDANKIPFPRRNRFLPKFKAGLEAEAQARQAMGPIPTPTPPTGADEDWAARAQAATQKAREAQEAAAEAAFDGAVRAVEQQESVPPKQPASKNPNQYQFVGVIQKAPKAATTKKSSTTPPITWYARKKPNNAAWSVRLVHVNQRAVLKDLFDQGKVDLMAQYTNTGQTDADTNRPVIQREYRAKPRGWRNLWNFSPKHFFTDSSGMYWRERRLRPGLYTDGQTVYESSYRYKDGRNGMHQYSSFQDFVKSPSVDAKTKQRIAKRLKEDVPDIVLEE